MSPRVLAALIYCGAAFGGSFLFMRIAAPDIPALLVAFGRVGIATVLLTIVAGPSTLRTLARSWRDYVVLALFMSGGPFLLFAIAERSITAGMGSIINATTPLWTAIILAAAMRHAPAPRRIAAIVIGFAGVGVIVGLEGLALSDDAILGVIAAIAGAASYGIALTWMRLRMAPQPPLQLAAGQLIVASVIILPFAALAVPEASLSTESLFAVLGIALFSTAIAWPLLFTVNRAVGPMATSTVTFLNPVFGTLWGALFLAETVSPTFLAGSLLVFLALGLIFDLRLPAALRPRSKPPVGQPLAVPEAVIAEE